jgi:hypothetical protein
MLENLVVIKWQIRGAQAAVDGRKRLAKFWELKPLKLSSIDNLAA